MALNNRKNPAGGNDQETKVQPRRSPSPLPEVDSGRTATQHGYQRRARMSRILQRALSGARSFLTVAWSKVTDVPLLTLVIAIGTLATALVAYRTALDSHEQVQLLKLQVDLNS